MKSALSSLLLLTSLSPLAMAQDVHQHGHARMNMVIDGANIEMELISPAANILGFEYDAKTAEEKQILQKAQDILLLKGELLFAFTPEAECLPASVTLEAAESDDLHDHEEHGHAHKKEDHGHDHDKHAEKHEEHDHGHKQHASHDDHKRHWDGKYAGEDDVHSDIRAHYIYSCSQPAKLAGMTTTLFSKFPGMEELDVQVLTANKQISQHLDRERTELEF